jgi:surfactin family lipopeptide synthetase A
MTGAPSPRQVEPSRPRSAPPLAACSRTEDLPLSFAQQRLWFIEQLEPGSASYNVSFLFRLHGPLDVQALRRALQEIVRRHEVLRTSFPEVLGQARQVISAADELPLPIESLEAIAESEQREALAARARLEARRPFDLARGPLLRAKLLRLAGDHHALVVVTHHIVCDNWSMGILARELGAVYGALVSRGEPPLPPLAVQYADFAVWQRRWLDETELERLLAYWRRQLADLPAILDLPTDRPRPALRSGRGARLYPVLPRELVAALGAFSRQERATLYMTLLAAFDTLLWRYSGQRDIVVGAPIAGRNRRELEGLIGFFATTLVLRVEVDGQLSFRELVRRVRTVCLEAYAHQDLPFEKLVDVLGPERDLSRTPLFQVMFGLQRPFPRVELGGSTLEPLLLDAGTSNFDLTLSLEERDGALAGWLEYSTDLFDAATIERMVVHYRALLEAAVARPDDRLAALPLLGAAEHRLLVDDWNRTAVAPPRAASVVELFEDQVRRTPDALALIAGERRLSYRELDARAERWAAVLRARGCGPDVRVALALSRSDAFPVMVLAALKAGSAYVPLDPAHPAERIAFMLRDCDARVLVTESALAAALPASPAEVVLVDARPTGAVATGNAAGLDDLAYISYTSGSTGRPKGVAMPHGAVLNLVTWQCARSPGAMRTLQFASPSFDVSFQELFATWASGGCLVLASEDERRDPSELLRLCAERRIERMFLPFVALHQLAEAAVGRDLGALTLREVITAGEQLRITPAIAAMFARLPACRLYNQYGPTETHLATEFALIGAPETWEALPSIGRPIANVRIYVLDDAQRPTPIGVPGELYIAGAGLARGYVGRPDLTAERFVPDPFGAPGARMYRTGDRAKYLARGDLAFLGRCDDQVKVRGYRIEPGEIEAVLGNHPAVREAAVVARADGGDTRLVAYVACGGTSIEDLEAHLRARLPDYMVPAVVMMLPALPLTPNGKVDRLSLPAPDQDRAGADTPFVAPATPVEKELAMIWAQVLNVRRVGIHDSFFDLGGHSLTATQVITRVRTAFGVEIPLLRLFEMPTIAEFVVALVRAQLDQSGEEAAERFLTKIEALSDEEAVRQAAT